MRFNEPQAKGHHVRVGVIEEDGFSLHPETLLVGNLASQRALLFGLLEANLRTPGGWFAGSWGAGLRALAASLRVPVCLVTFFLADETEIPPRSGEACLHWLGRDHLGRVLNSEVRAVAGGFHLVRFAG